MTGFTNIHVMDEIDDNELSLHRALKIRPHPTPKSPTPLGAIWFFRFSCGVHDPIYRGWGRVSWRECLGVFICALSRKRKRERERWRHVCWKKRCVCVCQTVCVRATKSCLCKWRIINWISYLSAAQIACISFLVWSQRYSHPRQVLICVCVCVAMMICVLSSLYICDTIRRCKHYWWRRSPMAIAWSWVAFCVASDDDLL